MLLFYFHNLLRTGDPVTDFIFFLIGIGFVLASTYFVGYGIYSMARYWQYLDKRLQYIYAFAPLWALLVVLFFNDFGLLISFPFGIITGIPAWILISIVFGTEHWIPDHALPYFGLLLNACGFLGLIRRISQFFGYR